jgi:hypothetical protein
VVVVQLATAAPAGEAAFITQFLGLKLRNLVMAPAQAAQVAVVVVAVMVDMALAGWAYLVLAHQVPAVQAPQWAEVVQAVAMGPAAPAAIMVVVVVVVVVLLAARLLESFGGQAELIQVRPHKEHV